MNSESAHSANMVPVGAQFSLDAATVGFEGSSVRSLSSNATGSKIMFEVVQDASTTGPFYRYGNIVVFDLATNQLTPIFISNETDGTIRATGATFSPDGQSVLSVYNYSSGGVVLPTETSLLLAGSGGVAFTASTDSVKTPLPPVDDSSSIGKLKAPGLSHVNMNPTHGIFWRPTIR